MQEDHRFSLKILKVTLYILLFLYLLGVISHNFNLNVSIGLSDPVYEQNEGYLASYTGFIEATSPQYADSQVLGSIKESKWRPLVEKYFPKEEVEMALMIIEKESEGYSRAVNWKDYHPACDCWGSFGLFQLGRVHMGSYGYNWNNRFDPETNVRVAYEVWKRQGWKIGWNTSYKKIKNMNCR